MQIFHPFEDTHLSIQCLDNKRLGKQRLECLQIINGTYNPNHPARLSYLPYMDYVKFYYNCCLYEWEDRGFQNNMELMDITQGVSGASLKSPRFQQDKIYRESHKVNLLRKDFEHYSQYFGVSRLLDEYPQGYYWPTCLGAKAKKDSQNWEKFFRLSH